MCVCVCAYACVYVCLCVYMCVFAYSWGNVTSSGYCGALPSFKILSISGFFSCSSTVCLLHCYGWDTLEETTQGKTFWPIVKVRPIEEKMWQCSFVAPCLWVGAGNKGGCSLWRPAPIHFLLPARLYLLQNCFVNWRQNTQNICLWETF